MQDDEGHSKPARCDNAPVEYAEFDAEHRRIVRSWSSTDPAERAAGVERLRGLAETVEGDKQRDKARRYLKSLDRLVAEVATPESDFVRRAGDVLLRASRPEGTPAERRARAEAGMLQIAQIADAAPTIGERDAALEMNESLAETIEMIDLGPAAS